MLHYDIMHAFLSLALSCFMVLPKYDVENWETILGCVTCDYPSTFATIATLYIFHIQAKMKACHDSSED